MADKTILVTGANRGIGFSIVQALAQRSSSSTFIVASRKLENAHDATEQLKQLGLPATFDTLQLDVDDDESIKAAVQLIESRHGKLDVLINNAGIAGGPQSDNSDFRSVYNRILNTNITSVALVSTLFLPLLRQSPNPRVINVSSGRGSLTLVTKGMNPPTDKIPYSVSKVALNLLTLELSHVNTDIEFQLVNPGWCKTAFNGWRGPKDPIEGARSGPKRPLQERILGLRGGQDAGGAVVIDGSTIGVQRPVVCFQ